MTDFENTDIEYLFFQYMEGELTVQEKDQLQEKLLHDPQLKEEFDLWQKSLLNEPLQDKKILETVIINQTVNKKLYYNKWFFSTLVVVISATILYFSFSSRSQEKHLSLPVSNSRTSLTSNSSDTLVQRKTQIDAQGKINTDHFVAKSDKKLNDSAIESVTIPSNPLKEVTFVAPIRQEKLALEDTIMVEKTAELSLSRDSVDATSKLVTKPQVSKPMLTKRELRKIVRAKEKALQKRRAEEFMKGKVPYVVPPSRDF